ncbi:MAG: alpha/beta fold hydrolase [Wenzhouxiangellaceae bacterium]|nr:alpha/beta fold hydrolase [Wenzhouxiangellaceae bacterium]
MPRVSPVHPKDLHGLGRLAVDGVAGITDLVEHLHLSIAGTVLGPAAGRDGRTAGLTGFTYRAVRGITGLVGAGLDRVLGGIAGSSSSPASSSSRDRALAILNGILGDHLHATSNPLAIPMRLSRAPDRGSRRLAVFVHGLCLADDCWQGAESLPSRMAEHGFASVQVRYNTGRGIADNGAELAERLEALVGDSPHPVDELILVGHSMGGLVARSAVASAGDRGLKWKTRLSRMVFLGTPHFGAPLERAGHGVDRLLGLSRFSAPFARLGRIRSAGITDLRHGSVAGLATGLRCLAIAASRSARTPAVLGDGLVPVASALGVHADPDRHLGIPAEDRIVVPGTGHLDLLCSRRAHDHVIDWLEPRLS